MCVLCVCAFMCCCVVVHVCLRLFFSACVSVLCTLAVVPLHSMLRHVRADTLIHWHTRAIVLVLPAADVLKNPRYLMAFSDREYIPAGSSSDDNLSDGSFGNDIDDDQGSATSVASDQSLSRSEAGPANKQSRKR
jgi:hypothetical protein